MTGQQVWRLYATTAVMAAAILGCPVTGLAQDDGQSDDDPPPKMRHHDEVRKHRGHDRPGDHRPMRDRRQIHTNWSMSSSEQIDERIAIVRQVYPELADQLEKTKESNPKRVIRKLHEHWPMLQRLMHLKKNDSQGFKLHVQDIRLAFECNKLNGQMRAAVAEQDTDKSGVLRQRLRGIVAEHFDVRQKMKEHELAKLEKRIDKLRTQLKNRVEKKDEIIQERLDEFTRKPSRSAW